MNQFVCFCETVQVDILIIYIPLALIQQLSDMEVESLRIVRVLVVWAQASLTKIPPTGLEYFYGF